MGEGERQADSKLCGQVLWCGLREIEGPARTCNGGAYRLAAWTLVLDNGRCGQARSLSCKE